MSMFSCKEAKELESAEDEVDLELENETLRTQDSIKSYEEEIKTFEELIELSGNEMDPGELYGYKKQIQEDKRKISELSRN
jgi:hypothetical protein